MESFKFETIDEAIDMLKKIKEKGDNVKVIAFTIDFDNEGNVTRSIISPDDGCNLVRQSETIIVNEDDFIAHMQLFSIKQDDVENIRREGKMHDIILPQ